MADGAAAAPAATGSSVDQAIKSLQDSYATAFTNAIAMQKTQLEGDQKLRAGNARPQV